MLYRLALISAAILFQSAFAVAETKPPASLAEAKSGYEKADAELNALYGRCVDPEATTVQAIAALRQAQRAWIAVRDGTARAYQQGESDRHALNDEYYFHGLRLMTLSRIAELETLFRCE